MDSIEKLNLSFFRRYALGLSLIALMSLCSFFTMNQLIEKQAESAEIINISGRQRMLSQRVSLYAELYSNAANPQDQDEYRTILNDEILAFKTRHEVLVGRQPGNGKMMKLSETLKTLYFSEPDATDRASLEFISAAEAVAAKVPSKDGIEKIHELLKSNFLKKLDRVVTAHQLEAEIEVANAKRAEFFVFLLTLTLLVCEARFIFRPMQKAIINLFKNLTAAREVAVRAAADKSNFLATITHEVRTPMIGVQGITSFLLKTDLNQGQKGQLETVHRMTENLILLINDILDFSKAESGKMIVESLPFNLPTLMADAENLFRPTAERKSIDLKVHLDASIPPNLRGDPLRINQVLTNLIGNALKFTSPGGSIQVDVTSVPGQPSDVIFRVKDTGIGLTTLQQAKLFQRYVQADDSTSRQFGGTGLGLAVSKQMVELMKGEIGVESEAGKGSTFWFRLNLPEVTHMAEALAIPDDEIKPEWKKTRILMAEDNVIMQKIAALMLQTLGCEVTVCNDGVEALSALEKDSYDLVLLDCEMPNMDGFAAARAIRLRELTSGSPKIPIIAMSAHIAPEIRTKCLDSGMDDYTEKPIKKQALMAILNQWLPVATKSNAREV
jgi:signal transduction histidine kinase/ActR/RegA family two-component response regulator